MAPSKDMAAFQELLRSSKNIIAVAGAGLSAASGLPTLRGADRTWRGYDVVTELGTCQAFEKSPSLVWQFYHYIREKALHAEPNHAHRALSAFSLSSVRNLIAPESTFTLVNLNVDGLGPRADKEIMLDNPHFSSNPPQEPSTLIEMHGRLFDVKCRRRNCGHVKFNTKSPICQALAGTEELTGEGTVDPEIDIKDLPRCTRCGALARPGVVLFGEEPLQIDDIDKLVGRADLCIVVGTSSTIYPAAAYAQEVKRGGGSVAVFNLVQMRRDTKADFVFLGPCEETLPKALGLTISRDGEIYIHE